MGTQRLDTGSPGISAPGSRAREELLDNDRVLVTETIFKPGENVSEHGHRFPYVTYVIEGGTLELTGSDGAVDRLELRPRETLWAPPLAHSVRNIGSTPVRLVEVEVKGGAGGHDTESGPRAVTPGELAWRSDPLDPRRETALVIGDPTQPGPYTVRLRVGEGYTIGLHHHPTEHELLTILTGSLLWSTAADGEERYAPAGSVLFFPAGTPHRLRAEEATTLQMTGVGPRIYRYPDRAESH